jgi:hypothetical protein
LHLGCRVGTIGLNTRHHGVYESRALLILNFCTEANGKPYAPTNVPPGESSQVSIQWEAGWASESVYWLRRRDTWRDLVNSNPVSFTASNFWKSWAVKILWRRLFYEISWITVVLGLQQSPDDRLNKSKKNLQ